MRSLAYSYGKVDTLQSTPFQKSSINLFTVRDPNNVDDYFSGVNFVQKTIAAETNPIGVPGPLESQCGAWHRLSRKLINR